MPGRVVWDGGIRVAGADLWLDPLRVRAQAFVSHAHADHSRRHRLAWMSMQTAALLPQDRQPHQACPLEFGVPLKVGSAWLTIHPAGHMLGAAQALISIEGTRILYSGDLSLRQLDGTRTSIPQAETLIIESTYGRPHFRFPDPAEVLDDVARWCRRLLDRSVTPVLVGHALGKTQELMLALGCRGFTFALDEPCMEGARAYQRAGVGLPDHVALDSESCAGRVVMQAPGRRQSQRLVGPYRSAFISGWAMEPGFWRRFGVDAALPLSDHCDFDDLLEVARLSGAEQIYTVHGFAEDLARHFRRKGLRASPLNAVEQLELAL
ncbi:MAG TPA: hypothetical protein VG015_09195 [Candidatus Dormibacteraeota bacterium]|jgi:Cft2 family RNA processing exonuclease|nr:hypothetical protein [Candidatus Dormibacteraeota bacterium]